MQLREGGGVILDQPGKDLNDYCHCPVYNETEAFQCKNNKIH